MWQEEVKVCSQGESERPWRVVEMWWFCWTKATLVMPQQEGPSTKTQGHFPSQWWKVSSVYQNNCDKVLQHKMFHF